MKKRLAKPGKVVATALLPILAACYLPLFMYFANADESAFSEILSVLAVFSGAALLAFVVLLLVTRSAWKAGMLSMIGAVLATNYAAIEKVFFMLPVHLRYWHVVAILAFLYICAVAFCAQPHVKDEGFHTVGSVCLIVYIALLAVNAAGAAPKIIEKMSVPQQENTQTQTATAETVAGKTMPNIYYFIFDEFSSYDTMKECYGYANDDFFHGLEDLGFTVSYDSHNMSYATVTVTANYLNYDYIVTDESSVQERLTVRKNNMTRRLMEQHGYDFLFSGAYAANIDWEITPNLLAGEGVKASSTVQGETLQDLILKRTIAYPVCMVHSESNWKALTDRIYRAFSYFSSPEEFLHQKTNTYTLAYFACPHEPFVFDENGNLNNPKYYYLWEEPRYYLHQYQYISKEILATMKSIVANDPKAIIILQSDHSARWASFIKDEYKNSILNAVYFGGEPIQEIKGKSGVNTLRTVYAKLFDLDLPDVEVNE